MFSSADDQFFFYVSRSAITNQILYLSPIVLTSVKNVTLQATK